MSLATMFLLSDDSDPDYGIEVPLGLFLIREQAEKAAVQLLKKVYKDRGEPLTRAAVKAAERMAREIEEDLLENFGIRRSSVAGSGEWDVRFLITEVPLEPRSLRSIACI